MCERIDMRTIAIREGRKGVSAYERIDWEYYNLTVKYHVKRYVDWIIHDNNQHIDQIDVVCYFVCNKLSYLCETWEREWNPLRKKLKVETKRRQKRATYLNEHVEYWNIKEEGKETSVEK